MPASRHQNHTTSPSVLASLVLRRHRVHRIPHPTFVTIAIRPSIRGGMAGISKGVSTNPRSEIFFRKGLASRANHSRVGTKATAEFCASPALACLLVAGAKGKLPSFDMIGSMRTIIERADVPSVFGHPVGINNALGSFEFLNYTVTLEEKASFKLPRSVIPPQVMSRIAEAQNYAFSCFVSSPADSNQAAAFHYLRGKVTYIYWGKSGEPLTNFVLHRDLKAIELGEWALTELGVKWIGSITSRAGIPANYGIPTNQWQRWSGWSSPR